MRKNSSYLLTLLVLLLFAAKPTEVKASHAAGGEIIYEWISDSTYRVFFKFYRDCTGAGAPTSQTLCYKNDCNTTIYQTNMAVYPGVIPPGVANGSPVALGCSPSLYPTNCTNTSSTIPGYHEWWYYADVTLPFQCNKWTFYTFIGNRNPSANLAGSTSLWFYTETTFNNTGSFQGNSSPYFSNKPIPYVCVNVPFQFNNGAVDPNGDSLSSDVQVPFNTTGSCSSVPTACSFATVTPPLPPYALPFNPIQTGNTFNLNAATGQMSFTAPVTGAYTLSVRTREFRGGVLIGSILRDVQVQVIGNCGATAPVVNPIPPSPIPMPGGQMQGCAGQLLTFGYDLKSPNPNAVLIGEDNHLASIPNATTTYYNQKSDSVRGEFSWTPGPNQSGLFNLSVTVRDSTCDPPGIMYTYINTIPIFIWPATKASNDTTVCPGQPVQLGVTGGGQFQWNVISGPGTLNNSSIAFPVATAYAPTTYRVVSNQTAFCNKNADTVVVDMLPSPTFTPLTDILTCPGVSSQFNLNLQPISGVTYNVKWFPATYLSSATAENPTVVPLGDVTYFVEIGATNNTCKGFDTVVVDVLDGFKILTQDTAICHGQSVKVKVVGDSRYDFTWTAVNDQSGNTSISNIKDMEPTIAPQIVSPSTGPFKYELKAQHANCPNNDSIASFTIEVQPNPTITLQDDAAMCHGDTMQLTAAVTPAYNYTYDWTPGTSLTASNVPNPIFKALATTTLKATVSTSAGCKDDDEISLTVFPADFVFVSADTAICPRDTATLTMVGNGLKSFIWTPSNNMSDATSLLPTVWPEGTQLYTVYARDTNGCFDTAKIKVTVKPAAIIDLPSSVKLYPGQSHQMDPKGNALYFSWFPPVGLNNANIANPLAKPEVNTRYIVKATTEFGCTTTDSVDVLISPDSEINLPNAFTPGHNSQLKVLHLGEARLKSFVIFNRWGQKMFETNNIEQGWDGTYNGEPQPVGVYIYTVEAESFTGRKISRQGNVTLIK